MRTKTFLTFCFLLSFLSASAQLYFPPDDFEAEWESAAPPGWCSTAEDSLYEFLEERNTKAFIILKDGKIVSERYFGTFSKDSIWYWASAGKSLNAFLSGLAQEEGLININNPVSDYLGDGWTECPETEADITYRHLMTMTTGLDDSVEDELGSCTEPECFRCLTDPGERWSYHNGPYWRSLDILGMQDGTNINAFTRRILMRKIGMNGLWLDQLFVSRARDMARFGLLMLAEGNWDGNTIMSDKEYFEAMINSSQELNKSYGYLWWLNGRESHMLPGLQYVFEGPLLPDGPQDIYAALGKNDQKIYVCPSQGLVVVRMGESAGEVRLAASSFDNQLWKIINDITAGCQSDDPEDPTAVFENADTQALSFYPNPAKDRIRIPKTGRLTVFDLKGRAVAGFEIKSPGTSISLKKLPKGIYLLRLQNKKGVFSGKLIID